jgi:hypothetical protein
MEFAHHVKNDHDTHTYYHVSLFLFRSYSPNDRSRFVLTALSIINIGLAVMMAALGVLTLINFARPENNDVSIAFLAVYMILFAILLFTYEWMWWLAIPWVNKILRKNFGFMYGLKGKGFYLVFVAFLCLGLGGDNSVKALTWATGISYLVFGVLHVFITCSHPTISLKYQAPTAGLLAKEYNSTTTQQQPPMAETPNPV